MAFQWLSSLPDDPLAALPNDPGATPAPKAKGLEALPDDPFAGLPDDPAAPAAKPYPAPAAQVGPDIDWTAFEAGGVTGVPGEWQAPTPAEAARVVAGIVPKAGQGIVNTIRGGVGLLGQSMEGMTSEVGPKAEGNPLSRFGRSLREEAASGALAGLMNDTATAELITPKTALGRIIQTIPAAAIEFAPATATGMPGTSSLALMSGLHSANVANEELAPDDPNRGAKMAGATVIGGTAGAVAGKLTPDTMPLSRAFKGAPWQMGSTSEVRTQIGKWLLEATTKALGGASALTAAGVAEKGVTGGKPVDIGDSFLQNLATITGFTIAHGAAQFKQGAKSFKTHEDGTFSFKAEAKDPQTGEPVHTWVTAKVDPDGIVKVAVPIGDGTSVWVKTAKLNAPETKGETTKPQAGALPEGATPEAPSAQKPVPEPQPVPAGPESSAAPVGRGPVAVPDQAPVTPAEPVAGSALAPAAGAGRPAGPDVEILAQQVQDLQGLSDRLEARAKEHPHVEVARAEAEEAADLLQAAKDRLEYLDPNHPVLAPPAPPAAQVVKESLTAAQQPTPKQVAALQPTGQATTPADLPSNPGPIQVQSEPLSSQSDPTDTEAGAQDVPETQVPAGAQTPAEAVLSSGPAEAPEAAGREFPGSVHPHWDASTRTWRGLDHLGPEPARFEGETTELGPDPRLQNYQRRNVPIMNIGGVNVAAGPRPPYFSFNGGETKTGSPIYSVNPRNVGGDGVYLAQGHDIASRFNAHGAGQVLAVYVDTSKLAAFDARQARTYTPNELKAFGIDSPVDLSGAELHRELVAEHGGGKPLSDYLRSLGFNAMSYDLGGESPAWSVFDPRVFKRVTDASKWTPEEIQRRQEFDPEPIKAGKKPAEATKTVKPGETFTHEGREYRMAVSESGQVKTRDLTLKGGPPIVRSWGSVAEFEKQTGLKVDLGEAKDEPKPVAEPNTRPEITKGARALAERISEMRNRKVKAGEGLLNLAQPRLLKAEPVPMKGTRTGTLDGNAVNPYEQKPVEKPVHPRAQATLDQAMADKDVQLLGQILHPGNKALRHQFEERTGVSLPKGWNATRAAIAKHYEAHESTEVAEKTQKTDTLPKKETPDARATGGVEPGGSKTGAPGRSKARPVDEAVPGGKPSPVPAGRAEAVHADLPAAPKGAGAGPDGGPGAGDGADVRPSGSGSGKPAPGVEAVPADQVGDHREAPKDEQPEAPRNSRNHRIEKQEDITPFDLSSEAQSKKAARANIEALKLLKKLEEEGRKATPEEQKVLAKYVGWGATTLSKMVDWSRGNKVLEATRLKEALESLKAEKGNNATYPPEVIDQVRDVLGWSSANRMGYSYGRPLVSDLLGQVNGVLDGTSITHGTGQVDQAWLKDFFTTYRELSDILTPDEMKAAWNSTLNAHYTSVPVVKGMWEMVKRLGVKGGAILEPSAGIGNFLGLVPQDILPKAVLQAVELDKMTGAFLKHLYPDAKVHIKGFQDAKIAPNSQDLVITNVPFGDLSISDDAHPEWGSPSIHNYFFLKGMEKLKPGGLMVAITSHFTLDSQGAAHRKAMAAMGDLVGAVRLPRTAFKANAGTEVVTDILILRKKAGDGFRGEPFQAALPTSMGLNRAGEEVVVPVNEYFKAHPEMVLGEWGVGSMRGNEELTVNPRGDLAEEMAKAIQGLPRDIASKFVVQGHNENEIHKDDEDPQAEGHLFVKGGQPMVIEDGKAVLHPWVAEAAQKWPDKPARARERAKVVVNYTALRDEALAQVARMMSESATEAELAEGRAALNKAYDAFTMRGPKGGFVPVNDPSNAAVFGDESSWARVCALENQIDQENGRPDYVKADIFTKRTIEPFKEPTKADSMPDALEISMNMRGGIDLEYMANLLGKDAEAVKAELVSQDLAFDNPTTGIWEPAYMYLGGEVRKKLREAQEAAKDNEDFQRHVKALEAVQPEWMQLGRITAQPGATWLPTDAVAGLVRYATGLRVQGLRKDSVSGRWTLDDAYMHSRATWEELGVPEGLQPWKFAEAVLLNKPLTIKWKDDEGVTHVDAVRTQQAQEAKSKAVERWHEGFYKLSDEGRTLVEDAYNNEVNNSVPINFPEPKGDRFPGMATEWGGRPLKLESYQKIGVSRALKHSTLLGHAVGSGKTITLIATAMEQRRLGFAKRPMISVLNSTVKQFVNAAYQLYPNAKILAPGKSERSAKDRAKLYARIATGDWDMVIIPQSFYEMIPVSADRVKAWIDDQVQEINDAIVEAKGDKLKVKDLERLRDSIRSQGDKMMTATDQEEPDSKLDQWLDEGRRQIERDLEDAIAAGDQKKIDEKKAWLERDDFQKARKKNFEDEHGITEARARKKAKTSKEGAKKAAKTTDRLGDLTSRKSDRFATFEDLGIDALLVDEAHGFKNGFFMTSLSNVKGLNPSASSKRAVGMLLKARSIQEKTAGRNITMATGTPITNTMSEAWVMMNYVRPDLLEEGGVSKFDEFISTYGDISSDTEYSASGKFEAVERLREFVNLQQLGKLWNQAVHVVPQCMILRDKLPKTLSRTVMVKPTPAQEEESAWWRGLMDEWKTWSREEKQKVPVGLLYSQISKFLSLDMRTIKRGLALSEAGGKVPAMVQEAMKLYKQYDKQKAAQAIFCDVKNAWKAEGDVWARLGRTGGEPGFNVFKEVKFQLVKAGVPESEIVIVDDIPDKDEVRAEVFDKVNRGEVRFIIGSTQRLGTGVNIQQRLIAMHNLDIPGRPCDNTQRLGRGERAGNMFEEIHWLTYGVEKTLDALMAQRNLNKTKFIQQIMEGLFEGDKAEDIGTESTFSWAEIRGALSGDPRVMRYGELQGQIQKMESKRNAWEQGRGDARVKLAQAKREVERFTAEAEALSKFVEKVPALQAELQSMADDLKKNKDASEPLEDWAAKIDEQVQTKKVSSSIGYENREFLTKLSGGVVLIRRASADWNLQDRPNGGASLKIQVALNGTGLPEGVTPRSGTSSPRLQFALESMARAITSSQEHAEIRQKWIREAQEAMPVLETKTGPFPDQEKLDGLRQEASDLETAINETAEAEKKAREEAKKEGGDDRAGEQGMATLDLLTAPVRALQGLSSTEAGKSLTKLKDSLQAIVAPASLNVLSQRAADIHSGKLGQLHLENARARKVLEDAHKAMAKLNHDQVLDLFDVLEGKSSAAILGDDQISEAVKFMRKTLDEDYKGIVGTGKTLNYIESYFPHMYAKPEKARPFLEEYAKRPMEGTKDWAKRRSIPFLSDAVRERGLEPASWNPIDMFLARHYDMQKFITAHQILEAYKKEKLAVYVKAARTAPEGFKPLDDRIASVSSIKAAVVKNPETGKFERQALVPGAKTVYGHYYAPEEVARIFNNYLAPGFTGGLLGKPYEFARTANNLLNMGQLGLSFFHGTFITIEGAAGSMSRGIMKLFRDGDIDGMVDVAKGAAIPLSVAETLKDGLKFRKALLSDDCPPEFRPLRDMFIRGGGRVSMDKEYGTPFAKAFVDNWRKAISDPAILGRLAGAGKGAVSIPFALVEAFSKPIMEFYVPVMKLGTMAQLFADELARLPQDASEAQIDRAARKVVDHVEDRMGQMTYDNLHWHGLTKQIMHLSLRAVGWDIGSWRMILGAGNDVLAAAPRAARALGAAMANDPEFQKEIKAEQERRDRAAGEFGHNRWMTYNIAQTFAVLAIVGLFNGLMTWLLTGEPPKEPKDLLFFRTGRKDKYGKDERLQPASYAKEVVDLWHIITEASPVHWEHGHPTLGFNLSPAMKYLWGKRAPLLGATEKFASNRDWRGQQVYTPNAGMKTLEDIALAAMREFLPISAVQSAEKWETQGGVKSVLPAAGLTKPKQEMINTKAENRLVELLADRMPRVIEKAKGDREAQIRMAKDAFTLGNKKPMDELKAHGLLTARDQKSILRNFHNQSLIVRLSNATNIEANDLMKVWDDMTTEEKVAVFPAMTRKIGSAFKSTPPAQRGELKEKWKAITEEVKSIKAEPRSSK